MIYIYLLYNIYIYLLYSFVLILLYIYIYYKLNIYKYIYIIYIYIYILRYLSEKTLLKYFDGFSSSVTNHFFLILFPIKQNYKKII